MKKRTDLIILSFGILLLVCTAGGWYWQQKNRVSATAGEFDAERAMADVEYQVNLGPRIPESKAHQQIIEWMSQELQAYGWQVEVQQGNFQGKDVQNVVAHRGTGEEWVILGAHYDSRILADKDKNPQKMKQPVPGANDGASGVAVLIEIARTLPVEVNKTVWLVFFDAEDNGGIQDWDWILGSRYFVENLVGLPMAVVVVDMVGDADLTLYQERYSDAALTLELWKIGNELGYSQFQNTAKYRILDDHVPFIEAGIPAVDIIDLDYPYWHTTEDTPDKLSQESLQAVGATLLNWLMIP